MNIRQMEYTDIEQLLVLGVEFYNASPHVGAIEFDLASMQEVLLNSLGNEIFRVIVAEKENELIGAIAVVKAPVFFNFAFNDAQELFWFVTEKQRNSGAGMQLLRAAENWAKENGCRELKMLTVDAESNPIVLMYKHRGYVRGEQTFIKRLT